MAKIEKPAAISRLDEILELADGLMVGARRSRRRTAVRSKSRRVQKRIVEKARREGKPVVVATQMLESMIESPTPTRAEVVRRRQRGL
jgi:pyruvate kinase